MTQWPILGVTQTRTSEFAMRQSEVWDELRRMPEGANAIEWPIQEARAAEASGRAFWPLGNTGLEKRLARSLSPI